jgi:hypothetical protein
MDTCNSMRISMTIPVVQFELWAEALDSGISVKVETDGLLADGLTGRVLAVREIPPKGHVVPEGWVRVGVSFERKPGVMGGCGGVGV